MSIPFRRVCVIATVLVSAICIASSQESRTTIELHRPIIEIVGESADAMTAIVDLGAAIPIAEGTTGTVWAIDDDSDEERAGLITGAATVLDQSDERATVSIELNEQGREYDVRVDDLVSFHIVVPERDSLTMLADVSSLAIEFRSEDRSLFPSGNPLYYNSVEIEQRVLDSMLQPIHSVAQVLLEYEGTDSTYREPLPSGHFEGVSLLSAMSSAGRLDLRLFLEFVVAYPARYMGRTWDISETFATWILHGTPLAPSTVLRQLREAPDQDARKVVWEAHLDWLVDDGILSDWNTRAESIAFDGAPESAFELNRIVHEGAALAGESEMTSWAEFVRGRIHEAARQYDSAAAVYRRSDSLFRVANSDKGSAFALNNLGSILIDLSRYSDAQDSYEKSIALKRTILKSDSTDGAVESLAHGLSGLARVHNSIGNYDSALLYFEQACLLYQSCSTSTSEFNTSWARMRIGGVLNVLGRYDEAIERLDSSRMEFRMRGNVEGEADVLDEVAYQHSLKGDYLEALNAYRNAHELHLEAGEINDAGFSMSNVGQMAWSLGDYYEAEKAHRKAILLREDGGDVAGQAYSWHKLGEMFSESGDPQKALDAYATAQEIYRQLGNLEKQSDVLESIGSLYSAQKAWRRALDAHRQCLEVRREIGVKASVAGALYNIGDIHLSRGDYEQAHAFFSDARDLQERVGDDENRIYSLTGLGLAAWNLTDHEEAYRNFNQALELARELESRSVIAWCYKTIGYVDAQKGETESAVENYERALKEYRDINDASGTAEVLIAIGNTRVQQGRFEEGLAMTREAESLALAGSLRGLLADALSSRAGTYLLMGEYDRALQLNVESLDTALFVDNPWAVANSYISLGNTLNAKGEYHRAVAAYNSADSVYRELDDSVSRATPINNKGTVWYFQGDYERALDAFQTALALLQAAEQEGEFLALVVGNIGEVLHEQGEFSDAEKWLRHCIAVADSVDAARVSATAHTIIAKTYLAQHALERASYHARIGLRMANDIGEAEQIVESSTVLGEVMVAYYQSDSATPYLRQAVETSRRIGSTKYLWRPLFLLGEQLQQSGDEDGALKLFAESVETLEELRSKVSGGVAAEKLFASGSQKVHVYEALISILIERGEIEKALGYLERSSNEDLRSRFRGLEPTVEDPDQRRILQEGREMKARIDHLADELARERGKSDGSAGKIERLQEIISVAEEDYIRFVNETVRDEPSLRNYFSTGVNPIELRQRKKRIPDDVAVISFLLGEQQLYIFAATSDTVVARVQSIPREEIEWAVRDLYSELAAPVSDSTVVYSENFLLRAHSLYSSLIEPVRDIIERKEKLAIIPSGDLHYVPFAALNVSGSEPELLGSHYAVFYISDLSLFFADGERARELSVLAFGNADGTLPNAETEVADIASLYPGSKAYVRDEATEDRAKNVPKQYNTLHFATHGNLDYTDFANSWLTLSANDSAGEDGRLTLEEIWSIRNLSEYRLVTLSACNTAVSDEIVEGWPINPANAFLQVGVPRVVATLWQVDDEATAILMRTFYENLDTLGAADALASAQRTLAASREHGSPYYWAPFVLLGDWR